MKGQGYSPKDAFILFCKKIGINVSFKSGGMDETVLGDVDCIVVDNPVNLQAPGGFVLDHAYLIGHDHVMLGVINIEGCNGGGPVVFDSNESKWIDNDWTGSTWYNGLFNKYDTGRRSKYTRIVVYVSNQHRPL
jgi:hypothetical protein